MASIFERRAAVANQVQARAHHLRLAAEGIGILHARAIEMRGANGAARDQVAILARDRNLARLSANLLNARIEGRVAALQRIDRHGAGDHRGGEQSSAPKSPASASAVETCVPLISARPSLACNLMGCNPALRSPSAAGTLAPSHAHVADAEQRRAQVRQGRQVPRCTHRTLRRNHRINLMLEQREQGIHQPRGDAGVAAGQCIDLERENQPHHGVGKRIAHARRVRQQQIPLQQLELLVGYAGLREQSESGIDAVGDIAARRRSCPPRRWPKRCARDPAATNAAPSAARISAAMPTATARRPARSGYCSLRSARSSAASVPARGRTRWRSRSPHRHDA